MKPMTKAGLIVGAATISGLTILTMSAVPAEARRAACIFTARAASGEIVAQGAAFAAKAKWACNRAERECKRKLRRKKRKGLNRDQVAARCTHSD
jgi:hypothetical protein